MAKSTYGTYKKYHYIYKTTNLLSGRYYIGMHSTNDINDGYLGSGTIIRRAIKKYGRSNFKLEIIEFCQSRQALIEREKEIICLQELAKKDCMNLRVGGSGGYIDERHVKARQIARSEGHRRYFDSIKENPDLLKEHSLKISKKLKGRQSSFLNKAHTELTKQKMSEAKKGKGVGEGNSQYGTRWITDGTENRKIKKEEALPIGWNFGRVLKD